MKIKKLSLLNFRNYKNLQVEFKDSTNVFVGNNAQGKTNLIEAIYYVCIGKSPRTTKEKELIKWNENYSKIEVESEKRIGKNKISVTLYKNAKKSITINDIYIKRIGQLLGEIPVIYFSPNEISLVKDGPSERRKFMDIDISQLNKTYFYLLCRYEKVLLERNKLLKQTKNINNLNDLVTIWDEQLSDLASKIILFRIDFVNKLSKPANIVHRFITDNNEDLSIEYQGITGTEEEIKDKINYELSNNIEKDYSLGYTTVGPHRDDLKILINGIDIREFGSQGQQRLSTLSLKIAELRIFKDYNNETPILLLDDVLSELDDDRKINLLKITKNSQTFITCTNFPYNLEDSNCKIFKIKEGKVVE